MSSKPFKLFNCILSRSNGLFVNKTRIKRTKFEYILFFAFLSREPKPTNEQVLSKNKIKKRDAIDKDGKINLREKQAVHISTQRMHSERKEID